MDTTRHPRAPRGRAAGLAGLACGWLFLGCASISDTLSDVVAHLPRLAVDEPAPAPAQEPVETSATDRVALLEMEMEWIRADLRASEAAMKNAESGLRGELSPADAVSILAESRIEVARADRAVPWGQEHLVEAREKLAEAERQLQAGQTGSSVFFASRARRIAAALIIVSERVAQLPGTRFIAGRRVNVRKGPSADHRVSAVLSGGTPVFPQESDGDWIRIRSVDGVEGWVHGSLLSEPSAPPDAANTQSLPASLAR